LFLACLKLAIFQISLTSATIGHNPSYVWQSILRAHFIVCGGAGWSIGSGLTISIFDEPWLLNGDCIDGNILGANFVGNVTISNLMAPTKKT